MKIEGVLPRKLFYIGLHKMTYDFKKIRKINKKYYKIYLSINNYYIKI